MDENGAAFAGLVTAIVLLALFGALFITASAFTYEVVDRAIVGPEQRPKVGWARFGAIMLGTVGALMLLAVPFLIWAAVRAKQRPQVSTAQFTAARRAVQDILS